MIYELPSGWLYNNCYQNDDGSWRVNLRRPVQGGDYFTEWAEAPTFLDAVEECISKLNDAEFSPDREVTYAMDHSTPTKLDLLSTLGLRRSTHPAMTGKLTRRI